MILISILIFILLFNITLNYLDILKEYKVSNSDRFMLLIYEYIQIAAIVILITYYLK